MRGYKAIALALAAVVAFTFTACDDQPTEPENQVAQFKKDANTGNGLPTGKHYTLHIHGADNANRSTPADNGQNMWVNLWGKTKINLVEGSPYHVLDANGLDGEATFQLPAADESGTTEGTTSTTYTVFAVGRGPGSATMLLCGEDPADQSEVCSTGSTLTIDNKGKNWENVVRELLYLWDVTICDDAACTTSTTYKRVALFDDLLEGYFWDYTNSGLRLATLRFYDCSTTVYEEFGDGFDDSACFQ